MTLNCTCFYDMLFGHSSLTAVCGYEKMVIIVLFVPAFIAAIPLCSLFKKPHLFSLTKHRFILIQLVTVIYMYMFRPVLRPSSGMSIQKPYKGRYNKNLGGPFFTVTIFIIWKHKIYNIKEKTYIILKTCM